MFLNNLVKIIFGNDDKKEKKVNDQENIKELQSREKLTIEHFDKKIKHKKKKKRK
jgi:hypothetical protein